MNHDLNYAIWGRSQYYLEEPDQLKQLAVFRYLQEAIDYARYVVGRGCSAVLTGGSGLATRYDPPKPDDPSEYTITPACNSPL